MVASRLLFPFLSLWLLLADFVELDPASFLYLRCKPNQSFLLATSLLSATLQTTSEQTKLLIWLQLAKSNRKRRVRSSATIEPNPASAALNG